MDRALAKPWWKKRPVQIGAAVVALAVAGGASLVLLPPPGTVDIDARSVDVAQVVRGPFQDYVPLRAEVVPLDTVYLTAQSAGRIDTVIAADGIEVRPGQVLARLSNPDLTLEVSSREADISGRLSDTNTQVMTLRTQKASREQELADATYALHKAEEDLSKRQILRQQGILNDANVKPYADEVDYQRSRLKALQASQAQDGAFFAGQQRQIEASAGDLRRSLGEVRQGLSALSVTAPAAGRLTDFELKPGQAVKQGDPLGEVDSEGTYKLRAQVDEFYLARLAVGLKGTANVHGRTLNVHITRVFPQVTDNHVSVEMQFDSDMPSDLKRGEAVDARLSLGNTATAVLAPSGNWLTEGNGANVFVVDAAGDRADRRPVSLGRRNPEYAEVTGGLKPGDRIVTGAAQDLTKAQHLHFTGPKIEKELSQ
jgi:HlyD family secretion protein